MTAEASTEASTAAARPRPPTSLAAMEFHAAIITDLVSRARNGDKQAWDALVARYAPLIWSICRKYELRRADAEDVGQSVWLHLVDHLEQVREPAALPGWLATTTRRECAGSFGPREDRTMRAGAERREHLGRPGRGGGEGLLAAERHAALREALLTCPLLPAADRPAAGRPACALCRDQRPAGHAGRQHRATTAAATWTNCVVTRPSPR